MTDLHGKATIYHNLGLIISSVGQYERAVDAHREASKFFNKNNELSSYAGAIADMGLAYWEMSRLDQSEICFKEAFSVFEALGNEVGMMKVGGYMGLHYLKAGNLIDAKERFEWQIEVATKLNYVNMINNGTGNLGVVCLYMGDYIQAIHFLNQDVEHNQGKNEGRANALVALSLAYWRNNEPEIANNLLMEAKNICEHMQQSPVYIMVLRLMAEFSNDIDFAITTLQQATNLSRETNRLLDLAGCLIKLAQYTQSIQEESTKYYDEACQILDFCGALAWLDSKNNMHPFLP